MTGRGTPGDWDSPVARGGGLAKVWGARVASRESDARPDHGCHRADRPGVAQLLTHYRDEVLETL